MARKAPIITIDEFKIKILDVVQQVAEEPEESGLHSILYDLFYANDGHNQFYKDISKIDFDFENYYTPGTPEDEARDTSDSYVRPEEKGVVGFNTLPSGIPFLGGWAGGDWEHPVYFLVYWDGKNVRGYVPTKGNTFNAKYKTAYGSEGNADDYDEAEHKAWVQKTFGVPFIEFEGYEDNYINLNVAAFIADANARIEVSTVTKPKSSKLSPAECTYDAREEEDGLTHVMIFPIDTSHPKIDNLRNHDLTSLPNYFDSADAENYWVVEKDVDTVKADMDALGFVYTPETTASDTNWHFIFHNAEDGHEAWFLIWRHGEGEDGDEHLTDSIGAQLPAGFSESMEGIFVYNGDAEEGRQKLLANDFIEDPK